MEVDDTLTREGGAREGSRGEGEERGNRGVVGGEVLWDSTQPQREL